MDRTDGLGLTLVGNRTETISHFTTWGLQLYFLLCLDSGSSGMPVGRRCMLVLRASHHVHVWWSHAHVGPSSCRCPSPEAPTQQHSLLGLRLRALHTWTGSTAQAPPYPSAVSHGL